MYIFGRNLVFGRSFEEEHCMKLFSSLNVEEVQKF
jgi:hypothetical protein